MDIIRKKQIVFLWLLGMHFVLLGQNNQHFKINWEVPIELEGVSVLSFEGANYNAVSLPVFYKKIAVKHDNFKGKIVNKVFRPVDRKEAEILKNANIPSRLYFNSNVFKEEHQPYLCIDLMPIIYNSSSQTYEKLMSFDIEVSEFYGKNAVQQRSTANQSKMKDGDWIKIGIARTGVHKITYQDLVDNGITSPKNIRVYGYGGAVLPERNDADFPDDMQELAVLTEKGSDGVFGSGDYILFYAEGPETWNYKPLKKIFEQHRHLYSDTIYYFVSSGIGTPKNIVYKSETNNFTNDIVCFKDHLFHEKDQVNLIKSGRQWYGEEHRSLSPSYNFSFDFPNLIRDSLVAIETEAVARCNEAEYPYSYFNLYYNNQKIQAVKISSVNYGKTNASYVQKASSLGYFFSNGDNIGIKTTYERSDSYSAWLDYIRISAVRKLKLTNTQLVFSNVYHMDNDNRFVVENASQQYQVWDVSNISEAQLMRTNQLGNKLFFNDHSSAFETYCVFKPSDAYSVKSFQKVTNQNLHALKDIEYVILSPASLQQQAERLADFHRTYSKLNTLVVTNQQVYNEFSSGTPDISAIKNFMRHLYHQRSIADTLKYLLLFGDGSYDNKTLSYTNTNKILTFQSDNSISKTHSCTSDDYFGLLDPSEKGLDGLLDIGVGRIPVNTVTQANNVVQKIINYHSKEAFGPWRSNITFIADNGDINMHIKGADRIASKVVLNYPSFNIEKIYMDAYPLVISAGANVVPEATKAIMNQVERGSLILNYVGHSGGISLAHEQLLTINDIQSWKNKDKLFVFITASCEFTGFDNKDFTSAGEHVLLNPNGGGIALFTATRVSFAGPNESINLAFFNHLYDDNSFRLGDLVKRSKNAMGATSRNMRVFALIGDPALRLAVPTKKTSTIAINNISVNDTDVVNISALSKVTVEGEVTDNNNQIISDFNGVIFPTVFDKQDTIRTLCQFECSEPFLFMDRQNIIYKGKASVKNGKFKYSFMVPKDISYKNGFGKITYYATNYETDGFGYVDNLSVSGSSNSDIVDTKGPNIDLFMNDENFVYGGTTNESPVLIAKLYDENGINTVGNGIGHDVLATLDNNTQKSVNLNEYYEADLDSYQSGRVKYPYSNLSTGTHTLNLKVWDIFNNSNEAQLEFVVAESTELAIKNLLNYPNPFTTHTDFYFEHNQAGKMLEVSIQIFTISGKLVKTIERQFFSDGFRSEPISWNGKDDYEDAIGKGVYIYKVRVRTEDGETATEFQKLVLLK